MPASLFKFPLFSILSQIGTRRARLSGTAPTNCT
jgi:hypothetical protein